MQYKTPPFVVAVLLLIGLYWLPVAQAQTAIDDIIITQVDASEFPQIAVRFRLLDRSGAPVSSLTTGDIEVSESGEGITPESLQEVEEGVWIHFVVDAGAGLTDGRWQNAHDGILNYVRTTPWMKEDLDHVAVTIVEASGPTTLVDFTTNANSVVTALDRYDPPGGTALSDPLPVLDTALNQLDLLAEAEGQARFVVFFTPALEKGSSDQITSLADKAVDLDIPIYSVLVRSVPRLSGNNDLDQSIVDLGAHSDGQYIHYQDNNSINTAYKEIVEYRRQYDLSYRSTLDFSGMRMLQIAAGAGATGAVSDTISYTVEVNPPRVLIESPEAGEIIVREATEYTEDRGSVEPTTQTVVANVVFPDGFLRRLRQATLLADGAVVGTVQNPGARIELSWNLRDIKNLGVSDFSLQVEVEDELGIVSTSPPITAKVDLVIPPKPTPNPEAAIDVDALASDIREEIESELAIPPIACFSFTPETLCDYVEKPVRRNPVSFISITISLVFAGVVWFNRDKAPVRAVRDTVIGAVDRLTKKYRGPAEARAYLIVLQGDVNVGKSLEVFGDTPIGRSKQHSELLFQQNDETSPLSRLHCTIIDEEDHFMLQDEDSANHTYLNGSELTALMPEELHDGDEIELARVERGGVRLLFQLARGDGEAMPGDLTKTKQTKRPVREQNGQDGQTQPPEEDEF